jgi:hypothetical protein
MKLSHEEEAFLRHRMYDEVHYLDGPGPAKNLQVAHRVTPADMAALIAAALPDPMEQQAAAEEPPPQVAPAWPWSEQGIRARVIEAKVMLAERQRAHSIPEEL